MRVLVTAASRHGATADIAQVIADALNDSGVESAVRAPQDIASVAEYDGVVVGSGVYLGRWLAPAKEFIQRLAAELVTKPVWLFSSGPTGDPANPRADPSKALNPGEIEKLVALSGAREHRVFAGRIVRHDLGFGERLAVAAAQAPEGDFRSPSDIGQWAAHIARSLPEPVAVA